MFIIIYKYNHIQLIRKNNQKHWGKAIRKLSFPRVSLSHIFYRQEYEHSKFLFGQLFRFAAVRFAIYHMHIFMKGRAASVWVGVKILYKSTLSNENKLRVKNEIEKIISVQGLSDVLIYINMKKLSD